MSFHVYPVNDLFEHLTEWPSGPECWCDPTVTWVDERTGETLPEALVVHNSADGRELTE